MTKAQWSFLVVYICTCSCWRAGHSHSTFPSLPASLVSSCRAAPSHHFCISEATSADKANHTASDNSVSFSSSLSLYQSIPEYFRQHMEPPEIPQQTHINPPAHPSAYEPEPPPAAGISGTHRMLRSASAARKPERANSLLDEFATDELQTLSKLLPASAAVTAAHRQPENKRSATPGSPTSASTVGSQPAASSELLSPGSAPRTSGRADRKRSSSKWLSCLWSAALCKLLALATSVCCSAIDLPWLAWMSIPLL